MNKPIRILYVDDYPLDRELVRDALEKEHGGFELVEASSRPDFESKLAQGDFDLILSDFNILGFEGLQVLDVVQAKDPRLPVIIVTGTGSEEVAAESIKRGAAEYVLKSPKHIQHLPVTILAVLERKRMEDERDQVKEELNNTAELFSLFMKHSPIYAYIKQVSPTESRVILASENYVDMVGVTGSKMVGMTMEQLFPPEFAKKISADDWSVVSNGDVLKLDEDLNGRHYTTIKYPIFSGGRYLLAGYTIDITELKQVQEEIRRLNHDLEQRVIERTAQLDAAQVRLIQQERLAVLGQMAGSMGHELLNPLGVITNAVYFLKLTQPEAGEQVKEYLNIIEKETRNAEKTIIDLLDYTRSISANRTLVDLRGLVEQTLERFPAPQAVTVDIRVSRNLPRTYADHRQIEQAMGNLIVNAYQAMPDGGVLTLLARKCKGGTAIQVKDTGIGIAPADMKRLFEPFYTTKLMGIGLGLAVSRKLTEANGGRLEAKSELGKGSIFTICLPAGEGAV